jgi:hypothetical protein
VKLPYVLELTECAVQSTTILFSFFTEYKHQHLVKFTAVKDIDPDDAQNGEDRRKENKEEDRHDTSGKRGHGAHGKGGTRFSLFGKWITVDTGYG